MTLFKKRRKFKNTNTPDDNKIDIFTFVFPIILSVFGLFAIYSAQGKTNTSLMIKQGLAIFLGISFMMIISRLNYEWFFIPWVSRALFCISVVLLVFTLIFGHGEGNRSWISIGKFSLNIQPSEFVKPLFIITYAKHLDLVKNKLNKIYNVLLLLLHAGTITGLVVLQGDVGTALVFVFIFIGMSFAAGISLWYILGGTVLTVLVSPYIWQHLAEYQQQRILVGFSPESDPMNFGYQQVLSKTAISNAGIFGNGFCNGDVSPLIPYNHTDMIFSVISEEFGLIGAILLMAAIVFLCVRMIVIGRNARKDTGSWICMGVATLIIVQTCENIGMCLGILPVIGITLPFISYGGSSVLSTFICIGIVLSVSRYRSKYYFERENA